MLSDISNRYPGLTLRVACQHWLVRHPRGLFNLAINIGVEAADLQSWLNGDNRRLVVAADYRTLEALVKWKRKHRQKPGPNKQPLDYERIRTIKAEGVDNYCNRIWAEYVASLASPAGTRTQP